MKVAKIRQKKVFAKRIACADCERSGSESLQHFELFFSVSERRKSLFCITIQCFPGFSQLGTACGTHEKLNSKFGFELLYRLADRRLRYI